MSESRGDGPIEITYEFRFADGSVRKHEIRIDATTLELLGTDEPSPPPWTALEFRQCSNCPLKPDTHPRCPVAANLSSVAEKFKNAVSVERAEIHVHSVERSYYKETTMQHGLQSVFGLIMATSGCPHMNFLKPLAKFHLPFATYEETVVRALSMHLLRNYFLAQNGRVVSLDIKQLDNNYIEVAVVNRGIAERIRQLGGKDADKNAIVILDSFAKLLRMDMSDNRLELEAIFVDRLSAPPGAVEPT